MLEDGLETSSPWWLMVLVGEEEFVEYIVSRFLDKPGFGERLSPGDDARDIVPRSHRILFSIDGYSLESVMLPWRRLDDIGWCLVSSVVSDIVCKTGYPYGVMVSIGIPSSWGLDEVELLYSGIRSACNSYGCRLLGGDTNYSGTPWASIACIGFTQSAYPPGRCGAREGDLVIATGVYGAMGVVAVDGVEKASGLEWVVEATRRPRVYLEIAGLIARYSKSIHASMDVSDGLGYTLYTIARCSRKTIVLDDLPRYYLGLRDYCRGDRECMLERVMAGGEEYGVVIAIDKDVARDFLSDLERYRIPYSVVGRVVEERGYRLMYRDSVLRVRRWDQFSGWIELE